MAELDPDLVVPLVRSVAREVARRYPNQVEVGDVQGALYVYLYENQERHLELLSESPTEEDFLAQIRVYLMKRGHTFATEELRASTGEPEGNYKYPMWRLKNMLPEIFEPTIFMSVMGDDAAMRRGTTVEATGGRQAELIDLRIAFQSLTNDHKDVLFYTYAMNWTSEGIAEELGQSPATIRKKLSRALKKLQRTLGTREAWEGRKVQSNAAWRADQSNQYEG